MSKQDLYAEITAWAIAQLEAGTPPWIKTWSTSGAGLPSNFTTAAEYSGVNILLLWHRAAELGTTDCRFATFKQIAAAGGSVRKGEKGARIIKVGRFIPKAEQAKPSDEQRAAAFLRQYHVFHVDQCDGLDLSALPGGAVMQDHERIPAAEAIAAGIECPILPGNPAYAIAADQIYMPPLAAFDSAEEFYRALFHEAGHATRHPSRLNRTLKNASAGQAGVAREELVAEMCAAFTCASVGIEPTVNHAAYIASWIALLKDDPRALISAAGHASKAADWLRGIARPRSNQPVTEARQGDLFRVAA